MATIRPRGNVTPRSNNTNVLSDRYELKNQLGAGGMAEVFLGRDRVLGRTIALPRCFEHSAPPATAFLRWLIEHPERMTWPERRPGERLTYGFEAQ